MIEVVAADVGGTHARFALATVADGEVTSLSEPTTFATADYPSFEAAWRAYGATLDHATPRAAAIAVASPVGGETIRFTNNPWQLHPARIAHQLGVDRHVLINDFGAVAHAVAHARPDDFLQICGPDRPLPDSGVTTVIGPGTGLGVAQLLRLPGGYHVLETEGGHIDFAPLDAVEDAVVTRLRARFSRVSAERIVAGPGIVPLYETLAAIASEPASLQGDKAIWAAALDGSATLAVAALDRFCQALGAVAGDLALAHGANAVVVAGGLGYRLRTCLARSGFAERFVAKGRFRDRMADIPVRLIVHPQPGLYGAAAAFARTPAAQAG